MQTTTTGYLGKRNYVMLAVLLAVAVMATSFGRWVIPSTGSESAPSAAPAAISHVPAGLASRLADLKAAQLDSDDRAAGLADISAGTAPARVSSQSARLSELKQAQLDVADETAGLALASANAAPAPVTQTQAERLAALKQAQLDAADATAGVTQ
jgi:hypothetical protein